MATVDSLAGHPLLEHLTIVSGSGDVPISLVDGVRLGDVLEGLATPTGLVVLLDRIDRTDWRFDRALATLQEFGVRAIVLDERASIAQPSLLLAQRLSITLLTTPDPPGATLLLRDLVAGGTIATATVITRTVSAIERASQDLDELLVRVGRALGRDVMLCDRTGRVIAPAGASLPAESVEAIAATDAASLAAVSGRVLEGLVTAPAPTGSTHPPLVAIAVSGAGTVEVDHMRAAVPLVAVAVGHRLAVARLQDERLARQRTSLLSDLTSAGRTVPAMIVRRAVDRGWSTDGWHVAIRIVPRTDVDSVAHRDDVLQAFDDAGVTATVVEQENGWAAWTSFPLEPDVVEVGRTVRAIRQAQLRWDLTAATSVGIGRVHPGPGGIGESLEEAADAARLAASRPNSGYFLHVDRLGLAQLLLAWTQTDTFLPAARELLAPLNESGRSRLFETLLAYLDSQSSATETATVLGVHRNTVTERIGRVESLLGVDLTDSETRLALHLACRSLDLS